MAVIAHSFRSTARLAAKRRAAGFSFTEVLFAVMILGIGFIMIAAIFPVALSQTKLNNEETAAATQTIGAVHYLSQYATAAALPDTQGRVAELPMGPNTITAMMGGNVISTADPRQGLIPLYRRFATWPFAQVIFVPVQSRNRATYLPGADFGTNATPLTFRVRQLTVSGSPTEANEQIAFSGNANDIDALGEGTYIVIAQHAAAAQFPENYLAGRIYRLGTKADPSNSAVWNLMPGADFRSEPGLDGKKFSADDVTTIPNGTSVFFVGRDTEDAGTGQITGAAQDVSAFTTFINLR